MSAARFDEALDEGWGVIRPHDRKAHYYRGMFSLCLRVGFYNGPLEPDGTPSPDDCAGCRKKLDREARAQGPETVEHVAQGIADSREDNGHG